MPRETEAATEDCVGNWKNSPLRLKQDNNDDAVYDDDVDDKKNPSTFDVKLGDDDDDDYIPITKMITCRSFNNCCPKGVELGDDAFLLMMVILQR